MILKLIEFPDVVSSEEPHAVRAPIEPERERACRTSALEPGVVGELKRKLDGAETVEAVIGLMRSAETQQNLGAACARVEGGGARLCEGSIGRAWLGTETGCVGAIRPLFGPPLARLLPEHAVPRLL